MLNHKKIEDAADLLRERMTEPPAVGLILGSGLGVLANEIENPTVVAYSDIPGFPVSTVAGHKGQFVFGELEGVQVAVMQGRFHFYEGYSMQEVTLPVRVMKHLGIDTLIVTNAAGGVNIDFDAGDLMLIRDHINWLFGNPLKGPNEDSVGVRFPDMSEPYSEELSELARSAASELGITLREGVYLAVSGPSYETPAEIRAMRKLGADAVGMSTVPEVIAARHAGIEVLGISCVTNPAAGILSTPLNHEEVMGTAARIRESFLQLVKQILHKWGGQ